MKILYILILLFGYSNLFGANFKVDTMNSDVKFKIKHMLFSTVEGDFKKFHGSYTYDAQNRHFTDMTGIVETSTLSTENETRDNFIKSVDFFDVQKYPQMQLKLLEHKVDKMVVALTIKDITKNIEMDIKDIQDGSFVLYTKINRKDFQLEFKKLKKIGGLTVGNMVKITLNLRGILVD